MRIIQPMLDMLRRLPRSMLGSSKSSMQISLWEAEAPVSCGADGQRAPPQVYAALNAIGEVAWCINRPVLDALQHAGGREMQIGSMPPLGDLSLRNTPKGRAFAVQRAHKWLKGQLHVTVSRAMCHLQCQGLVSINCFKFRPIGMEG